MGMKTNVCLLSVVLGLIFFVSASDAAFLSIPARAPYNGGASLVFISDSSSPFTNSTTPEPRFYTCVLKVLGTVVGSGPGIFLATNMVICETPVCTHPTACPSASTLEVNTLLYVHMWIASDPGNPTQVGSAPFAYYFTPSEGPILAISPLAAPAGATVLVTLNPLATANGPSASDQVFSFGTTQVQATIAAAGPPVNLTFVVPASADYGTFTLRYSDNGGTDLIGVASATFTSLGPPAIYQLVPSSGPFDQTTSVTVVGQSILPSSTCKIGTSTNVKSTWVDYQTLVCDASPVTQPTSVPIEILAQAPNTFTDFGFIFDYTIPHTVTGAQPSYFSAAGSSRLTVIGANFRNLISGTCSFSVLTVPPTPQLFAPLNSFLTDSSVVCITPPFASLGINPPVNGLKVTVDYANNGLDYTKTSTGTFTILPPPAVSALFPTNAPPSGGTLITLFGANISPYPSASSYCKFGNENPAPSVAILSTSSVVCRSPSITPAGQSIPVEITSDSTSYTSNNVQLMIHMPVFVSSMTPRSGPFSPTGFTVTISGTNFFTPAAPLKITVTLGTTVVDGTLISASSITFPVNGQTAAGTVFPRLSFNGGANYFAPANPYTLLNPITITAAQPNVAFFKDESNVNQYDETGSPYQNVSPVTLTGTGFVNSGLIKCRWFNSAGAATATDEVAEYISSTTVLCPVPAIANGVISDNTVATVAVANNGVHFGVARGTVTFVRAPSATSVTPSAGPETGGTTITLLGSGFPLSLGASLLANAVCTFTFNNIPTSTKATVVSTTTVTCPTPANALVNQDTYAVSFSLTRPLQNAVTFGTFTYYASSRLNPLSIYRVPISSTSGFGPTTVQVNSALADTLFKSSGGAVVKLALGYNSADAACVSNPAYVTDTVGSFDPSVFAGCLGSSSRTLPLFVTRNDLAGPFYVATALRGEKMPTVTGLSPSFGPATGGTRVTLIGTGFFDDVGLFCKFGIASATAIEYSTPSTVICTTPSQSAGAVNVFLGLGSGTGMQISTQFTYVSTPSCTTIAPSGSISVAGGLTMTLQGASFSSSFPPIIAFTLSNNRRNRGTSVTVSNANQAVFISPQIRDTSFVGTTVGISISLDDQQWVACSSTSIGLYAEPVVTSISPSAGLIVTPSFVTVTGSNFNVALASSTVCRFGTSVTAAAVTLGFTSTQFVCQNSLTGVAAVGITQFSISQNGGAQYTASPRMFEFIDTVSITSIAPTWTYLDVPLPGTYLTIRGTGFMASTRFKCSVNGVVSDTLIRVSSTQVVCMVPVGYTAGAIPINLLYNSNEKISATDLTFTYVSAGTPLLPTVSAATPLAGPIAGGTVVQLYFDHAVPGSPAATSARCWFGNSLAVSSAVTVSGGITQIECTVPPAAPGSPEEITGAPVPISVSVNAGVAPNSATGDILTSSLNFQYTLMPTVTRVAPNTVHVTGGATITVSGISFPNNMDATFALTSCKFSGPGSDVIVTASSISVSGVVCIVPDLTTSGYAANQLVNVDMAVNNQASQFTNGKIKIRAITAPTVVSVIPNSGSISGGTVISVTGTGFVALSSLACMFTPGPGDTSLAPSTPPQATFVTSTLVMCTSPSTFKDTGIAAALSISINDGDEKSNSKPYLFIANPTVSAVFPATVSAAGNVPITLYGTGFYFLQNRVRFNSRTVVTATPVSGSTTVMVATVPPINTLGTATFDVSTNAVEFYSNALSLTVSTPAKINSVTPATANFDGSCPPQSSCTITVTGSGFITSVTSFRIGIIGNNPLVIPKGSVTVTNPSSATFVLPPYSAGTQPIEVSVNDVDYTQRGVVIQINGNAQITSLSPNFGPTAGGTMISVIGTNFVPRIALFCRFGQGTPTKTVAVVATATLIVCKTPPQQVAETSMTVDLDPATGGTTPTYYYVTAPSFSGIAPNQGQRAGGALLTISGSDLIGGTSNSITPTPTVSTVSCRFGPDVVVAASSATNSEVKCTIPRLLVGSTATKRVYLSNNGIDYYDTTKDFDYMSDVTVSSVTPTSGPTSGAYTVTVAGSNFVAGAYIQVTIPPADVRTATCSFVDSTKLECQFVPGVAAISSDVLARIDVFNNPGFFTQNSVSFFFANSPAVSGIIAPTCITNDVGGVITVSGTSFVNTNGLRAKLASQVPVWSAPNNVLFMSSTQIVITIPGGTSFGVATYNVIVSINAGASWTAGNAAVSVTYVATPLLTGSLVPTAVPLKAAGSVITINGSNLKPPGGSSSLCRFAGLWTSTPTSVAADGSSVVCPLPSQLFSSLPWDAMSNVAVALSVNSGSTFSTAVATATMFPVPRITGMTPTLQLGIAAGAQITLFGANFWSIAPHTASCVFSNAPESAATMGAATVVAGNLVSSTQLECLSPVPNVAGLMQVDVTLNSGAEVTQEGMLIRFMALPAVTISPSAGPADGGTSIRLALSTPGPSGYTPRCDFGTAGVVSAVYFDGSVLQCTAPMANVGDTITVKLVYDEAIAAIAATPNYKYEDYATVTSVVPRRGDERGGYQVTLHGSNFLLGQPAKVQWGLLQITCQQPVDATKVVCLPAAVPPAPFGYIGDVEVKTTRNGQDYGSSATFSYINAIAVTRVSPATIQESTATVVTIFSPNFGSDLSEVLCRFGSGADQPAITVSPTEITCSTGTETQGQLSVSVSVNGGATFALAPTQIYVSGATQYTSYEPVLCSAGAACHVFIKGSYILETSIDPIRCRLGTDPNTAVDAMVSKEETDIICPFMAPVGTYSIYISLDGTDSGFVDTGLTPLPFQDHSFSETIGPASVAAVEGNSMGNWKLPRTLELTVTNDFKDLITNSVVTRFGTIDANGFRCRFGSLSDYSKIFYTPVTAVVGNVFKCNTPDGETLEGDYGIVIEAHDGIFSTSINPVSFLFYPCAAGAYCNYGTNNPSQHCEQGYMCPGTANAFMTPCPPGTYQDQTGQESCLPCPRGYTCPTLRTINPVLCDAGFVCDEEGLMVAVKLCPPGYFCQPGVQTDNPLATGTTTGGYPGKPEACGSNSASVYCPGNVEASSGLTRPSGQTVGTHLDAVATSAQVCLPRFQCYLGEKTPQGSGTCPLGYECPVGEAPRQCLPGYYAGDRGSLRCSICPKGSYSDAVGSVACKACPIGSICPDEGMTRPVSCPAGYACITSGAIIAVNLCPAGYYCPGGVAYLERVSGVNSTLLPIPCPIGYYCLAGVTSAVPWPAFNVFNTTSATELALLINSRPQICKAGTYCAGGAATELGTGLCPAGYYCPVGSTAPSPSGPGYYSPTKGRSQDLPCPRGSYSDRYALATCIPCPPGYLCPATGTTKPQICPAGSYRGYGENNGEFCSSCPVGTIDARSTTLPPRPQYYQTESSGLPSYTEQDRATYYAQGLYDFGHGVVSITAPFASDNITWSTVLSGRFGVIGSKVSLLRNGSSEAMVEVTDGTNGAIKSTYSMFRWEGAENGTSAPSWWHPTVLTSASMCKPCPAGFHCDNAQMDTLKASDTLCPAGFVCAEGSTLITAQLCPGGFMCYKGADPISSKKYPCPAGKYCPTGTSPDRVTGDNIELYCRANYYCPEGSAEASNELYRCPDYTKSASGSDNYLDCVSTNEDRVTLHEEVSTVKAADGKDLSEYYDENTGLITCAAMSTCEFNVDVDSLKEKGIGYGSSYRPAFYHVVSSVGEDSDELERAVVADAPSAFRSLNILHSLARAGYLRMGKRSVISGDVLVSRVKRQTAARSAYLGRSAHRFLAKQTSSSSGTNSSGSVLTVDTFYRIPPPDQMYDASKDNATSSAVFVIQPPRDDLSVQVVVEVVNGLYVRNASSIFSNMVSFDIHAPTRTGTKPYSFLTVVPNEATVELPLNLINPTTTSLGSGQSNLSVNASETSMRPATVAAGLATASVSFDGSEEPYVEPYALIRTERSSFFTADQQAVVLPYLPFFSSCGEYDSYVTLFKLLESEKCSLKEKTETVWAAPWSPATRPKGDVCDYNVKCAFEERLDRTEFNPRWYELKNNAILFYITSQPAPTADYAKDGDGGWSGKIGSKSLVPVVIRRSSNIEGLVPRTVRLALYYQQVTEVSKRILKANLFLEDLEPVCPETQTRCTNDCTQCLNQEGTGTTSEKPNIQYTLNILFEPLAYVDLLVLFAFDTSLYVTIYMTVAVFTLCTVIAFWLIHRFLLGKKTTSKLHFRQYFSLNVYPHYTALIANVLPVGGGLLMIWWLFGVFVNHVLGKDAPGDYMLYSDSWRLIVKLTQANTDAFSTGRYATGLIVFSFIILAAAAKIFVPERSSTLEELTLGIDHKWTRAEFLVSAFGMMTIQLVMIEFSYSSVFSEYAVAFVAAIGLLKVVLSVILLELLKDRLLVDGLMLSFTMAQYIIPMGANNYFLFIVAFIVTMWIDIFSVMYYNRWVRRHVPKAFSWLRRQFMSREALEDAEANAIVDEDFEVQTATYDMITYLAEATVMELSLLCSILVFGYLVIFASELKIYQLYPIPNGSLLLYLVGIFIIVSTLVMGSVFLHHTQEMRHGWRIFEYLDFMKQRSEARGTFWQRFHPTDTDRTIHPYLRSVDAMCFSMQYCISLVFFGAGSIIGVFGIEMAVRSEFVIGNTVYKYNLFADPLLFVILLLVPIGCLLVKTVFVKGVIVLNEREMKKRALRKKGFTVTANELKETESQTVHAELMQAQGLSGIDYFDDLDEDDDPFAEYHAKEGYEGGGADGEDGGAGGGGGRGGENGAAPTTGRSGKAARKKLDPDAVDELLFDLNNDAPVEPMSFRSGAVNVRDLDLHTESRGGLRSAGMLDYSFGMQAPEQDEGDLDGLLGDLHDPMPDPVSPFQTFRTAGSGRSKANDDDQNPALMKTTMSSTSVGQRGAGSSGGGARGGGGGGSTGPSTPAAMRAGSSMHSVTGGSGRDLFASAGSTGRLPSVPSQPQVSAGSSSSSSAASLQPQRREETMMNLDDIEDIIRVDESRPATQGVAGQQQAELAPNPMKKRFMRALGVNTSSASNVYDDKSKQSSPGPARPTSTQ